MVSKKENDRDESVFKSRREQLRLTQRVVAKALHVTVQTVSNWETGKVEPRFTLSQVKTLAKLFQWSLDELPDSLLKSEE